MKKIAGARSSPRTSLPIDKETGEQLVPPPSPAPPPGRGRPRTAPAHACLPGPPRASG